MNTQNIPVASAKKGKNTVTLNGIEIYGRKYGNYAVETEHNSTYTLHIVSGAVNYKPTKKGVINTKTEPWKRMPKYLQQSIHERAIDKIVDAFGMNKHYADVLKHPYK